MLLLGIAACIRLTGVRWTRLGGTGISSSASPSGASRSGSSARASTTTSRAGTRFRQWWGPFAVWQGGLGVWGGILFGCLAGAIVSGAPGRACGCLPDAVAPGLLLAQGIGRLGNWLNQELFGKPTDLPWGLEIDPEHRPRSTRRRDVPSDLPVRAVCDLTMAGVLILIGSRFRIRPPGCSRSTSPSTRSGARSRSCCASTRRITSPASGSTSGCPSSSCLSSAFFVWWQFLARRERGRPTAQRKPRRDPGGPDDGRPEGPRPPAPLASARC